MSRTARIVVPDVAHHITGAAIAENGCWWCRRTTPFVLICSPNQAKTRRLSLGVLADGIVTVKPLRDRVPRFADLREGDADDPAFALLLNS
jgi:hypothetical protein